MRNWLTSSCRAPASAAVKHGRTLMDCKLAAVDLEVYGGRMLVHEAEVG